MKLIHFAKVSGLKFHTPTNIEVEFKFDEEFPFKAGQFLSLQVAENTYRAYSICSSPRVTDRASLIVSVGHVGIGSNYIKSLKVGDSVKIIGPSGRFHIKENVLEEIMFLATGTGIAPFIAMLHELQAQNYSGKVKLYLGVRHEADIVMQETLENFQRHLKGFEYFICVSKPSESWKGLKGRITAQYTIPDPKAVQAYICGNPDMVSQVHTDLLAKGVAPEHIHHEKFTRSA